MNLKDNYEYDHDTMLMMLTKACKIIEVKRGDVKLFISNLHIPVEDKIGNAIRESVKKCKRGITGMLDVEDLIKKVNVLLTE